MSVYSKIRNTNIVEFLRNYLFQQQQILFHLQHFTESSVKGLTLDMGRTSLAIQGPAFEERQRKARRLFLMLIANLA